MIKNVLISVALIISVDILLVNPVYSEQEILDSKTNPSVYVGGYYNDNIQAVLFDSIYQKAKKGDIEAFYILGDLYYYGQGTKQSYKNAFKWYYKSATKGYLRAEERLGFLYENGFGVTKNYSKAAEWYHKASIAGSSDAQYSLGLLYYDGKGVAQDFTKAAYWWKKASWSEYNDSRVKLAYLYLEGRPGVPQSDENAFKWFKKAADGGVNDKRVMDMLGFLYEKGRGVEKNILESKKWYRKSKRMEVIRSFGKNNEEITRSDDKRFGPIVEVDKGNQNKRTDHKYMDHGKDVSKEIDYYKIGQFIGAFIKFKLQADKARDEQNRASEVVESSDQNLDQCYKEVSRRIASCWVTLDGCNMIGECNYEKHCDKNTGLFDGDCDSGFMPYEEDYYCDPVTGKHSADKEYLIDKICP